MGIPVSTALAVRSSGAHGRLREVAVRAVQEELGLRANLGRVRLELIPFAIVANDVALDDPIYGRLAEARTLRIRPSLRALFRGTLDLAGIDLEDASVRLVIRDGAIRNVPRIESPEGGGPPTLPFRELVIRRSSVTIDAEPYLLAEVRGVEATVRGEEGHVIAIDARAEAGEITHGTGVEPLTALAASVRISADHLGVPAAELAIGPLVLAARDAVISLPLPSDPREVAGVSGHVEIDYDLAHLGTLALPFSVPRMAGLVSVRADVTSRDGAPLGLMTVHGERVSIEQFGIGDALDLNVEATSAEVRIVGGSVRIQGGGGTVGVRGTLGLTPELPLDVVATLDDLSFAHLMDQFEVTQTSIVEWLFDGEMRLSGSLRDLELAGPVDLSTRDFVVSFDSYDVRPVRPVIAIPRGRFTGRWSIRSDAVRFHDLVGELPQSRISGGEVLLGFHNALRVEAHADGSLAEVAPLAGFGIAGVGHADCHIDGTFQDPRVTGHLDFDGFEFDGMRFGDIVTDATLDRDGMGVTFPLATANRRDSRYAVHDLYLDFHHDRFALDGRLELQRMTLADFYDVFSMEDDERFSPYQGVTRGSVAVRYTNGFPDDAPSGTLRTIASLDFDTISLSGYAFERGHVEGSFDWLDWARGASGARLTLDEGVFHKGEGTVVVAGEMTVGGVLRMTAAADRIELSDLEGIGDRFPELAGIASLTASISGTADEMRVDADTLLSNVVYAGRPLGDARAYVRMTNVGDPWIEDARGYTASASPDGAPCPLARAGLARADWAPDPPIHTVLGPMPALGRPSAFVLCGEAFGGQLDFDVAIGRTQALPVRGRIALRDLDLGRLFPSLSGAGLGAATGHASGAVLVTAGGLRDLEHVGGRVDLDSVAVDVGDVHVESVVPVRVAIEEGTAIIERARFRAPGSRLRVRGEASLERGLGLELDSEIDLSLLPQITPSVREADGTLRLALALTGAFGDPEVFGEASLERASMTLAALESPIEDLHGHATFTSRRILVEEVAARLAGGEILARGEAELERRAIERWRFDVSAEHLAFEPVEGITVAFSADTTVASAPEDDALPEVSGELVVEHFAYERPIALGGATLDELTRTERAETATWDPGLNHVTLDLAVTASAPFVVSNNLVDGELSIDAGERGFRLVGTDQRFGAIGDLRFDRGTLYFRNTAFEVRPGGLVAFDSETSIDPRFDVRAATEIRRSGDLTAPSWRILLDAEGTRDALTLTTHADPDLPQEDILLLLAIGMTGAELEALQVGDVGGAVALEALASVTGVDREVRRALPVIDDFRIGSAYSVRTGRTEPRVTIGKRITDRVRLSATTSLSEAREFRAVVEATLDETTSVTAGYDNYNLTGTSGFGNIGADLRWRLEFE